MPNLIPIEKEKDDDEIVCCGSDHDSDHYPFGTELDFRDEMVDKLSLNDAEVGTEVTIISTGFIRATSERKNESVGGGNDESKTVSIQLTAVQVTPALPASKQSSAEDIIKTLYPEGE